MDVTQMDLGAVATSALDLPHPQDAQVRALLESAFAAFDAGRYPDARAGCQAALALRPDSTAAHSLLGLVCEKEGKTAEAIHQFQIVLELNPNSAADRQHLERLQRLSSRVSALPGPRRNPSPAMAGGIAALLVLGLGLWGMAGLMKPSKPREARVGRSNIRVMRGAPGTVSPGAASTRLPVRLPAPTMGTGRSYTMMPGAPYGGSSRVGVGGVPTTVQTNARMTQLAPRLFGTTAMPGVQPTRRVTPSPRRQVALMPAPVRMPRLDAVPQTQPVARSRYSPVPQLPDPRGGEATEAGAEVREAPAATGNDAPPVTPPVLPTPAGSDENTGSSYIRIRPVTEADRPSPPAPQRSAVPQTEKPQSDGASLAEARLHQQNGLTYWRQGDYAAAAQEYEFAAQLFGQIAARHDGDAAAALAGLRASQQGIQASRGRR
jgi:tetratricopeptide (TPR) repeat protein